MILSKLKWAGLALLTAATLAITPTLAPARPAQDPPKADSNSTRRRPRNDPGGGTRPERHSPQLRGPDLLPSRPIT